MSSLIDFLTSKEIIVVYIVAAFACLLCFVIYLVEKNTVNFKRKLNTKKLNKLVEENDEIDLEINENFKKKEVAQNKNLEASSVSELIESTLVMDKKEEKTASKEIDLNTKSLNFFEDKKVDFVEKGVNAIEEKESLNKNMEEVLKTSKIDLMEDIELLDDENEEREINSKSLDDKKSETVELMASKIETIKNSDYNKNNNENLESFPKEDKINLKDDTTELLDGDIDLNNETLELIAEQEKVELEAQETIEELDLDNKKKDLEDNELEYTSIEPDPETAKLELEKITEELKKQENIFDNNIALTNYEEEQEENAIISLEELMKKSKEMYAANEVHQYADEGNEPISLQDLEARVAQDKLTNNNETFVNKSISREEVLETKMDNTEVETLEILETNIKSESEKRTRKFRSSPIISPIYGIEKTNDNELELENTANYEKLDEEIKKTNEFLMTLRELQSKLD